MKKNLKRVMKTSALVSTLMLGYGCSSGETDGSVTVQLSNESANSVILNAVNNSARDKQSVRDQYRNPAETLSFFGLKEDMTVVEVWPGGGWYTSIINPVVKDKGHFIGAHFHMYEGASNFVRKSIQKYKEKIDSNPLFEGVELSEFHQKKVLNIAPEGSADMVLTFRNLHNWYMFDGDVGVENAFKSFYKVLKKGGVLGVVDHRMPEHLDQKENKRSGYMKQSYTIAAAERAGFKLVATSEINSNAKDTTQHPKGVWTLLPNLRLGDKNKAKYMAIGESDRMTLKFVKE